MQRLWSWVSAIPESCFLICEVVLLEVEGEGEEISAWLCRTVAETSIQPRFLFVIGKSSIWGITKSPVACMKRDGVGRLVEVLDLIIYDAADVCVLGV